MSTSNVTALDVDDLAAFTELITPFTDVCKVPNCVLMVATDPLMLVTVLVLFQGMSVLSLYYPVLM